MRDQRCSKTWKAEEVALVVTLVVKLSLEEWRLDMTLETARGAAVDCQQLYTTRMISRILEIGVRQIAGEIVL